MQDFKTWLVEAKQIQISQSDGSHTMSYNDGQKDTQIGNMDTGYVGGDTAVAMRMFPGIIQPGETASRIHGIYIDDKMQGYGLGQLLYLRAFDKGGSDWYYNSQTEPPATNALKSLARKGYIELHWKPAEPNWYQPGGIHLARITPLGREAYRKGQMVKKDKLKRKLKRLE